MASERDEVLEVDRWAKGIAGRFYRSEPRRRALEYLGESDGVLVVDETGFLEKGPSRWGCSGSTVGRRDGLKIAR